MTLLNSCPATLQPFPVQESGALQSRGSLQHAGSMPPTGLPPPQIGFRRTVFGNLLANQPPEQPQLSKATPVTPPARYRFTANNSVGVQLGTMHCCACGLIMQGPCI